MHSGLAQTRNVSLMILLLTGCGLSGVDFQDDPDAQTSTSGTCNPEISDLEFTGEESSTLGTFIRSSFTYALACNASISGSTVRVHVVDLDADDPDDPASNAYYDLPMDSAYVDYESSDRSAWIDFSITDETRTYEFALLLVDSRGYISNELSGEVVFAEVY